MKGRRSPQIRAGSGDSHEARLAILEKRFSEDMQARCSWCDKIKGARAGDWLEVLISTPGTGVATSHVFKCLDCENEARPFLGTGIVAVPRRSEKGAKEVLAHPAGPYFEVTDGISEEKLAAVKARQGPSKKTKSQKAAATGLPEDSAAQSGKTPAEKDPATRPAIGLA